MKVKGILVALLSVAESKKKCHRRHKEEAGIAPKVIPETMKLVPVPRSDYVPKTTIKCAYEHVAPDSSKVVHANFKIDTTRPTLNLDNFVQIKKVDCVKDLIHLTFDTTEHAKMAYDAWSTTKNLAVMLGYEHKCKNIAQTATMAVEKVLEPKGTTLVLDTVEVDAKKVFNEYEIDISQYDEHGLVKRDGEVSEGTVPSTLERKITYPVGLNYNATEQAAIHPNITIFKSRLGSATCLNCYLHGQASIGLYIKATNNIIKEYKISLATELKANLDLVLKVAHNYGFKVPKIILGTIPLAGTHVPGFFSFGPVIKMHTAATVEVDGALEIQYGYSLGMKVEYAIESKDGLFGVPKVTKKGEPLLSEHKFKASENMKVKVIGHMYPSLALQMSMLKVEAFNMNFELDSRMGALVSEATPMKCPANNLQTEAYRQYEFSFNIKGVTVEKAVPLVQTGQMGFPCSFCDKCIAPLSGPPSPTTSVKVTTTPVSGDPAKPQATSVPVSQPPGPEPVSEPVPVSQPPVSEPPASKSEPPVSDPAAPKSDSPVSEKSEAIFTAASIDGAVSDPSAKSDSFVSDPATPKSDSPVSEKSEAIFTAASIDGAGNLGVPAAAYPDLPAPQDAPKRSCGAYDYDCLLAQKQKPE